MVGKKSKGLFLSIFALMDPKVGSMVLGTCAWVRGHMGSALGPNFDTSFWPQQAYIGPKRGSYIVKKWLILGYIPSRVIHDNFDGCWCQKEVSKFGPKADFICPRTQTKYLSPFCPLLVSLRQKNSAITLHGQILTKPFWICCKNSKKSATIRVVGPSVALFTPPENFFGAYPPPRRQKRGLEGWPIGQPCPAL